MIVALAISRVRDAVDVGDSEELSEALLDAIADHERGLISARELDEIAAAAA